MTMTSTITITRVRIRIRIRTGARPLEGIMTQEAASVCQTPLPRLDR
jgi:hypothetical protein